MSEPTTTLLPAPAPASANGPPASEADARLSRIEAALVVLAAQQAAGPPPEGYSRPGAPLPPPGPNPLTTLTTAVEVAQMTGQLPGGGAKRAWMKWPVVRELILVFRLYVDKRYSPTRAAQLGVPIILGLLVVNWAFFAFAFTLPIVAQILERLVIMGLAVVLFRILSNEVARYAQVLEYLTKTGRG